MKLPRNSIINIRHLITGDPANRTNPMTEWVVRHSNVYRDKTVLDLGSNAGHFPLAYAINGAKSVTAIEPRKCFEKLFNEEIRPTIPEAAKIKWHREDIRACCVSHHDVISCLGLLYHVENGWRTIEQIVRQARATTMIFESMLWPTEHTAFETARSNSNCYGIIESVPRPSFESVEKWFANNGWRYECQMRDWSTNGTLRAFWLLRL